MLKTLPERCQCMMLPAQSGKTSKMQELMQKYSTMNRLCGAPGAFNIVICSNNKTLVCQTAVRMDGVVDSDEEHTENDDTDSDDSEYEFVMDDNTSKVYSWFSGSNNNKSAREVAWMVTEEGLQMVICCAHHVRIKYVKKLITLLNKKQRAMDVWIDEADSSIKLWSKLVDSGTLSLPLVDRVTLISATFNSVFKMYKQLPIMPFEKTHLDIYHKFSDSEIVIENTEADAFSFVKAILKKYDMITAPGMKCFIPGDHAQSSHDIIERLLLSKGFAVVVVNGSRKQITVPNGNGDFVVTHLSSLGGDTVEIGEKIKLFYHANNLQRFPFAITGQMCVGRGLSFQREGMLFDFGILHTINNASEAYQTGCRMNGNVKHLPDYKPCLIFTTSQMQKKIIKQEEYAVTLARLVYEQKNDETSMINQQDLNAVQYGYTSCFDEASKCKHHLLSKLKPGFGRPSAYSLSQDRTIQVRGQQQPLRNLCEAFAGNIGAAEDIHMGVSVKQNGCSARIMPFTFQGKVKWVGIYNKQAYDM